LAARLVASGFGGAWVIISALTLGTLSRPRIAVVAAPRTRKQVRTTMVMALDKRLSDGEGRFTMLSTVPGKKERIKA
jgi:hypothetical protein